MNTQVIHKMIARAREEYEQLADQYERGECSKRDLLHAQRKLYALRAERDLLYAAQPVRQAVTA